MGAGFKERYREQLPRKSSMTTPFRLVRNEGTTPFKTNRFRYCVKISCLGYAKDCYIDLKTLIDSSLSWNDHVSMYQPEAEKDIWLFGLHCG